MTSATRDPRRWCLAALAWGAVLLFLAGCGNGDKVEPPAFSPDDIARQAMAQYDTNKDGFLSGDELDRAPAFKSLLRNMEKEKEGRLSTEDIANRLRDYQKSKVGLVVVMVVVTLDGQPLPDATVTFVPEAFLGPNFKPAKGVTNDKGRCQPRIEGQESPGVAFGLYRIEVTSGKLSLPPRYDTETTLGQEIGPDSRTGAITLALNSR